MDIAPRHFVIGWKVSALEPQVASVRYRALLPVLALEEQHGFECRVFSDQHAVELGELDALVIVKGLGLEDFELAQKAFARQIPIILDLCDNIFAQGYGESKVDYRPTPSDVFSTIARYASAIVVSTEPLEELVRLYCGDHHAVVVIPDGVESSKRLLEIDARLRQDRGRQRRRAIRTFGRRLWRSMHRLQDFGRMAWGPLIQRSRRIINRNSAAQALRALARFRPTAIFSTDTQRLASAGGTRSVEAPAVSAALKLLWFGIHGAEHGNFGMLDLLLIQADLEQIAQEFDVELVVVSNHREKFERHIKPLRIKTRYLNWSAATMEQQLREAALVLMPNSLDSFSLCKSANRTALALTAGVPVVATLTPALRELSDCIRTGSFLEGMRWYLSNPSRGAQSAGQGQAIIQRVYGSHRIATLWLDVLNTAVRSRSSQEHASEQPSSANLVVSIYLVMDIDLALPVIRRAQGMGIEVMVLCNSEIRAIKPDIETLLRAHCRQYLLVHRTMLDRHFLFPASATALLTFSETNLRPHAFNHQLTKMANRAGLATFTTQHGFENVGLTYDDSIQPIRKISFAAQHIFIWGSLETLHPSIPPRTRRKCIPIGCPKPERGTRATLPQAFSGNKPVVGIFENLHWKRYSDAYREAFISNVMKLARMCPEVLFLVKPHNAGLWLTSRFRGELPSAPNVVIADPRAPQWASTTASGVFWRCAAVITTPSTVALDAARYGLPVAVVAQGLSLNNYAPLPLLHDPQDWWGFVADALEAQKRPALADLARKFCRRVVLADGADLRMVEALFPQYAKAVQLHDGASHVPAL
jgi:glycosyltransferase involved in cell wall biosynthesis